MWKRFAYLLLVAACFVPLASAQDDEHVQVGVFADYLRLSQTDNNFGGVGAQVSFHAYKEFKLEGTMAYDFNQTFTEGSPTAPEHFRQQEPVCGFFTESLGRASISGTTLYSRS